MGYWRRSANLRWRKREARGAFGCDLHLEMQPSVTNAKKGWLPRKVKCRQRTAPNQGNRTLLGINVTKRLPVGTRKARCGHFAPGPISLLLPYEHRRVRRSESNGGLLVVGGEAVRGICGKMDPTQQVSKTRVGTQRVEKRINLQNEKKIRSLFVGLFQPGHGFIFIP